jgi:type IV secretion system protein TrbE
VLAYLFHRIEGRLDGRPTLLIVDEGWLALDDPTFGARLREWLKTLRKKNASVVFATQSLADIDTSTIASTTEAVEGARRLRLTGCLRGREQ